MTAAEKEFSTLVASFALLGRELRLISKGGCSYFEVRYLHQARSCSTSHDLHGLLRQIGAAP